MILRTHHMKKEELINEIEKLKDEINNLNIQNKEQQYISTAELDNKAAEILIQKMEEIFDINNNNIKNLLERAIKKRLNQMLQNI